MRSGRVAMLVVFPVISDTDHVRPQTKACGQKCDNLPVLSKTRLW